MTYFGLKVAKGDKFAALNATKNWHCNFFLVQFFGLGLFIFSLGLEFSFWCIPSNYNKYFQASCSNNLLFKQKIDKEKVEYFCIVNI